MFRIKTLARKIWNKAIKELSGSCVGRFFGRISGVDKVQAQVDTLFYFLNAYADIGAFPKANGPLSKLQQGDILLLQILDSVCKKHDLQYWLDSGTLLGAVRHKGFIPWDDDMDVCMLRSDYERAVPILKAELGQYGIDAEESVEDQACRIGVGYRHSETGLWIDILPFEFIDKEVSEPGVRSRILREMQKYKKIYNLLCLFLTLSREQVFTLQKKIIPEICSQEKAKALIYSLKCSARCRVYQMDDVFPLEKGAFEGCEFWIPHNVDAYLEQFYGKNYMSFPRSGIENHGGENGLLKTWAEKSGTDMDEVLNYLRSVLKMLQ